jgi:pyridoxine 5-phosphate synthase
MPRLGVNIDHVATIRQARRATEPDPVWAAAMAELGGADQITVHLREDRRHIQDRDLRILKETVNVKLNLECALEPAMLEIACELKPDQVCLVPEKREEVTTEGGLDVLSNRQRTADAINRLVDAGIFVSLFLDPLKDHISLAKELGADAVELHTGAYANAKTETAVKAELNQLREASDHCVRLGLRLHAGHGLTYSNVLPVAKIPDMEELNIGHSIISRSIFVGLQSAVREMKNLCELATR